MRCTMRCDLQDVTRARTAAEHRCTAGAAGASARTAAATSAFFLGTGWNQAWATGDQCRAHGRHAAGSGVRFCAADRIARYGTPHGRAVDSVVFVRAANPDALADQQDQEAREGAGAHGAAAETQRVCGSRSSRRRRRPSAPRRASLEGECSDLESEALLRGILAMEERLHGPANARTLLASALLGDALCCQGKHACS